MADSDRQLTRTEIEQFTSTSWASATFESQRYSFVVRFDGARRNVDAAARQFQARLAEGDMRLPGHVLADMALVGEDQVAGEDGKVARRLRFEALTVRDQTLSDQALPSSRSYTGT